MWNSSTSMSGSPFCRQAATMAPSSSEARTSRYWIPESVVSARMSESASSYSRDSARRECVSARSSGSPKAADATSPPHHSFQRCAVHLWSLCRLCGPLWPFCGPFSRLCVRSACAIPFAHSISRRMSHLVSP